MYSCDPLFPIEAYSKKLSWSRLNLLYASFKTVKILASLVEMLILELLTTLVEF